MDKFASFDGLEIAYSVTGEGPDVLLMHGFGASAQRNWVQPGIADAIRASGRRVIAYDARGHGESGKPHEPAAYEHDAMRRDAQALLDHLGVTKTDVVGYSMGAIQATRLVPQEPRARSLALGGIGGRLVAGGPILNHAAIADALADSSETKATDPQARAFRRFAERSGNDLAALAAMQRSRRDGERGNVEKINVPTLVIVGADDRLVGDPQRLVDKIPGATLIVTPGDHLTAVAVPEMRDGIVGFLARVSPV